MFAVSLQFLTDLFTKESAAEVAILRQRNASGEMFYKRCEQLLYIFTVEFNSLQRTVRFLINAVWVVSCLARAGQRMDLSTTAKIQITKENESRCREETMDIFGVKKDAKRSLLCRDRREFGVLQSTLGDLRKDNETRIRHYEDDMRNLQWALYNLRLEQTGKNGQLILGI